MLLKDATHQVKQLTRQGLEQVCRMHCIDYLESENRLLLEERVVLKVSRPASPWVIETRQGFLQKEERISGYKFEESFTFDLKCATRFPTEVDAKRLIKSLGISGIAYLTA